MRTFEERKSAIFSLSEKRIKSRKAKRIRVAAIVLPLFICVIALSVLLKPYGKSDVPKDAFEYETEVYTDKAEFLYSYVNITADNGEVKNYSVGEDNHRIVKIAGALLSFFDTSCSADSGNGSTESVTAATGNNAASAKGDSKKDIVQYKIEVKDISGTTTVYNLYGNKLTNLQTGDTATLTRSELQCLLEDLGFKVDK